MVWKSVGYYVLLIMAALQTVPSSIYEAAELDDTPKVKMCIRDRLIGFAMLPPSAFASAVATMTAQNMGAGRPERALSLIHILGKL